MKTDAITMTLLFDHYGALLTEKQRSCLELHYNQDLSLGEIAENEGISRQGVHDTITRAERALLQFEQTTGGVRRAAATAQAAAALSEAAAQLEARTDPASARLAAQIRAALHLIEE